ncbi:MAG TPA: hypothetical protein VFT45_06635 [Longimicrobium sp.]|nr:hypothetical protein [Longimicrobium sp.]
MKKIKLEIEALQVESFPTVSAADELRGTVHGNQESIFAPEATCGDSCLDPNSCRGTCFCSVVDC